MFTIIALICFAVAALIGAGLAVMYNKGKLALNLAYLHGLFGAAGLIFLLIPTVQGTVSSLGTAALIVFVVAAVGGAVLFANHLKKALLPKPLIAIHGAAAVIAFLLLLVGAIR